MRQRLPIHITMPKWLNKWMSTCFVEYLHDTIDSFLLQNHSKCEINQWTEKRNITNKNKQIDHTMKSKINLHFIWTYSNAIYTIRLVCLNFFVLSKFVYSSKYWVTMTCAPFEIGFVLLLSRRSKRRRLANGACDFGRMIRMAADETFIELMWLGVRSSSSAGWSKMTGTADPDPVPVTTVPTDAIDAIDAHPLN